MLEGSSCSGQVEVQENNIMYIPSSTSEGTSITTRTSAVGACTPNHERAIAYGFIFAETLLCVHVITVYIHILCSLIRGYDYKYSKAHSLTPFSLNTSIMTHELTYRRWLCWWETSTEGIHNNIRPQIAIVI